MDCLKYNNGYIIRKNSNFDPRFVIDCELLFIFLNDTQPEAMDVLCKIYKTDFEDTFVNFLYTEMTKAKDGLMSVLKHGLKFPIKKLELMYTIPATTFNMDLLAKYVKNIFSVIGEVWASEKDDYQVLLVAN